MTVRVSKSAINLRDKLSELDIPVGAHGTQLMKSADAAESFNLVQAGRKNLIINGDFRIAQRSTSIDTAGAQSTYHSLDRWMTQIQSGTITESQQSLSSSDSGPWEKGFRKYMRILNKTPIGAGIAQYAEIDQRIEAQDLAQSGWEYTSASSYITLSFWIRASVTQNYIVVLYSQDGTQRHFPFEVPLNANIWTKVTKSIPGYTGITVTNDTGSGLAVCFIAAYGTNYTSNNGYFNTWNTTGGGTNRWPDMATTWSTTTNATFDITGVQLEAGSIATSFEHRPYAEELELCQRYYIKDTMIREGSGYGVVTAALDSIVGIQVDFPVTMRDTPDVTLLGTTYRTGGSANADRYSSSGFIWGRKQTGSGTFSGAAYATGGYTAKAEL